MCTGRRHDRKLSSTDGAPFVSFPSGDGPRHFIFHPNAAGSTHWAKNPQPSPFSTMIRAWNAGFCGRPSLSASRFFRHQLYLRGVISPDGGFSTPPIRPARYHRESAQSMATVRLTTPRAETSTMGDYPRHCTSNPSGDSSTSAISASDSIACFKVRSRTGLLTFTGQYTPVGNPPLYFPILRNRRCSR